jgi:hypothetical protein
LIYSYPELLMFAMTLRCCLGLWLGLVVLSLPALAQTVTQPKVEVLASGLDQPWSVAVRPIKKNPIELLVAECGSGRAVSIKTDKPGEVAPLITGLPTIPKTDTKLAQTASFQVGYVDQYTVLTADWGQSDTPTSSSNRPAVRTFKLDLGPTPAQTIDKASSMASTKFPGKTAADPRQFTSLSCYIDTAYLMSRREGASILVRCPVLSNKLTDLTPFIDASKFSDVGGRSSLAMSPRGELLIALGGQANKERDSQLLFMHPVTGSLLLKLSVPLLDTQAIQYQRTPRGAMGLFALDLAEAEPEQGGLYRLDAVVEKGRDVIKSVPILTLDQPTAMACDEDGNFYVTILGRWSGDSMGKPGQLLRISGF